jgi:hypothetical protein
VRTVTVYVEAHPVSLRRVGRMRRGVAINAAVNLLTCCVVRRTTHTNARCIGAVTRSSPGTSTEAEGAGAGSALRGG